MKSSTLVAERGVDLCDDGAPQAGAVLEQVVHDERAEDHAAGDRDERADAGDQPGEDAGR